jgi:hypothetical protein
VESLENRAVPAIVFANRGQPSDTFTPAEHKLIERAIQLWEQRLSIPQEVDINFIGGYLSNVNLGPGILGMADFAYDPVTKLPNGGTITISSNAAVSQGGRLGWYVDPYANDNTMYAKSSGTHFWGGPFGQDELTTLEHEVGHMIGFSSFYPGMAARLSPIKGSSNLLFTGSGGFTAVFDGNPAEGGNYGHLADSAHPGDPMNPDQQPGERSLPSYTDARVLADAFGYHGPLVSQSVGAFDPSTATWYLRSSGVGGAVLSPFNFGSPGWIPLTGDWNNTGVDTVGVFDPTTATFYLRNENSAGAPDAGQFQFGLPGWIPVVGDWNGNGRDSIGVYDPATGTFYLRNENSAGPPDAGRFQFGPPGTIPLAGHWNGSWAAHIGVYDPSIATFYLRNANSSGPPDAGLFVYGLPGWRPVVGSWDGGTATHIGVYDPTSATFYLRYENSAGPADAGTFVFGSLGWEPLSGNWSLSGSPDPSTARPRAAQNLYRDAGWENSVTTALIRLEANGIGAPHSRQKAGSQALES